MTKKARSGQADHSSKGPTQPGRGQDSQCKGQRPNDLSHHCYLPGEPEAESQGWTPRTPKEGCRHPTGTPSRGQMPQPLPSTKFLYLLHLCNGKTISTQSVKFLSPDGGLYTTATILIMRRNKLLCCKCGDHFSLATLLQPSPAGQSTCIQWRHHQSASNLTRERR